MDAQAIDQSYEQLQTQSQQTIQALTTLAGKLQAAGQAGDPHAREWQLDLKEIALGIQGEQNQVTALLQAIHGLVDTSTQPQQTGPQASDQQPQYPQGQYQQPVGPGGGGGAGAMLQRFLGGGLGRSILSGAGFGIGDDLINHLFR